MIVRDWMTSLWTVLEIIFALSLPTGASHRLQERTVPATQTSVLLNDLQPGTTYLLRVVAENDVGRGESSEPFKLRTEEEGQCVSRNVVGLSHLLLVMIAETKFLTSSLTSHCRNF